MEQFFLNGLSLNEFFERIGKLLDSKLIQPKEAERTQANFLSRQEVCKLLKISLPTLNDWTKLGRLQSYKIGNRVLYKPEEIENSLHQVASLKFKKGMVYGTDR